LTTDVLLWDALRGTWATLDREDDATAEVEEVVVVVVEVV
jgi:hypothetical protein